MKGFIERRGYFATILLVFFSVLLAGAWSHADTPTVVGESAVAALQQRLVETLARGADAGSLLAELEASGNGTASRSRIAFPPPQTEAATLAQALSAFRGALEHARRQGPSAQLSALVPAYEQLWAADALVRAHFDTVAERLAEIGAAPPIMERLQAARSAYLAASDRILGSLTELQHTAAKGKQAGSYADDVASQALQAATDALDHLKTPPSQPILRASLLPYRRTELPARAPALTPAVQPAYLSPTDSPPTDADRQGSLQAPLSEAILRQAQALGYDPVAIYEFVRNEIDTEWYAGAMKGAEETLRQRRGNDVDQASLLIALLRAGQLPARYVYGVVELTIEVLAADLGLTDPDQVPTALARAGIAFTPVIGGGRIAAVQIDYTWVTAQVPYANYRGAVVDFSGKVWVPLAPAAKRYTTVPATGILPQMGFPVAGFIDDYLSAPQSTDPLTQIRRQVEDYLAQSNGGSYAEQLGNRSIEVEQLELLPNSLPFPVIAVTGESAALEENRQHRVRLVVRGGASASAPVLLDVTLPLAELAGQRVTLSYLPATVEDHRTVNAFGGLYNTPVYLIQVRAHIKLGGRPRAVAETPLALGIPHRLEITLITPSGRETVTQTVLAGSYHALSFGAPLTETLIESGDDPADTERVAAQLLSQVAHGYSERWDAAESQLAGLFGVSVIRPLPSAVIASNAIKIENVLGLPYHLNWQGVTLDAALRVAEPLVGERETEQNWMRLSALQGSALEHRIFEELFQVDSISADKGLGLARAAGVQVLRLDAGNVNDLLPTLSQPQSVKSEIAALVSRGAVVEVPRLPTRRNAWYGSVWRAENPRSGGAGYFLSGGLAGGATSEAPGNWVLDFLVRALASPYLGEPNTNPAAAVLLLKLSAGDGQIGEVGEILPTPLAAVARDKEGRPVQGAPVTFAVAAGGGKLISAQGTESTTLTVPTNAMGIAEVGFRSGELTAANPLFVERQAGDEFQTQALLNEVEAWIAGAIVVDAPFNSLAYPGAPAALARTDSPSESGLAGTWVDTLQMAVQDRFGNPVSNVPVTFRAGVPRPHCEPPPASLRNAVVFAPESCPLANPVLGDCGSESLTRKTSIQGVVAGVILGNSANTTYTIEVGSPGLSAESYALTSTEACDAGVTLRYTAAALTDEQGRNINAARAGQASRQPVAVTLMYSEPDYDVRTNEQGFYVIRYLPTRTWRRTTGDVSFSVSNGGSADAARFLGEGTYETTVTTGLTPGRNEVTFAATGVELSIPRVDPHSGTVSTDIVQRNLEGELPSVTGVDPRILQISPEPIRLDAIDVSVEPITFDYAVEPADYRASLIELDVFRNDELLGFVTGSSRNGAGIARLQRGRAFDVGETYRAELVLNRSSVVEIRSDPVELPLTQHIFRRVAQQASRSLVPGVTRQVVLAQEVDRLNNRICTSASRFDFSLTQPARITLTFTRITGRSSGGELQLGGSTTLIANETFTEGDHERLITPEELTPGAYAFEIRGVSLLDGREETVQGHAVSQYRTRDALPVGHTLVKGVDLWDGRLALSREDLAIPGRGVPLEFRRTYASSGGTDGGLLGVGWTHNYNSRIVKTPCDEFIVIGGQGGGMRFVADGTGGLRPLKGYHGSLVANPDDNSFDFYPKDGTRFHYTPDRGERWRLAFIEDPNGNRTTLIYDDSEQPRLLSVRDPGGRTLDFRYTRRDFLLWSGEVLTQVQGPGGLTVHFEYDEYGNLIRVAREGDSRVERYDYAEAPDTDFDKRHLLISAVDELRGARTEYAYVPGAVEIIDGATVLEVPNFAVAQVTEPEGGATGFEYDRVQRSQKVTDRRGYVTTYTLNRYGSPLEIEDPLGQVTAMEWAADDVVMTRRTDANGMVTDFAYDEHGNRLRESVQVTDADGASQVYTIEHTYYPPTAFNPPYLKNRVKTTRNRNGALTQLDYDARGNLVRQAVQGTDFVITHRYAANGDRLSTTDPNGHTTAFTYDELGNLTTVTDPLGGITETDWNERGLPIRYTDPLGRVTTHEYDTLDRLIRTVYPAVDGVTAVETTSYDDRAGTVTATDAEGRVTVTATDREGRTVSLRNALGDVKTFGYDAEGNKILESDWQGQSTRFSYDEAGRLINRSEPLGRLTRWEHDAVGNVVRETLASAEDGDFVPRVTMYDYDALNRRMREHRLLDGETVTTTFQYDGEGNRVEERDPLGRITAQRFDALNRLLERVDALGNATTFAYDASGNRVLERRQNSPQDQLRRTEYDALNRVSKRIDAEGHAALYEYDAADNLLREIDPRLNVVSHSYDARDRRRSSTVYLDRVSGLGPAVTEFDYDRVGNQTEIRQPNGNVITHRYDARNRRIESTDSLGPLASFSYDANGNGVAETDANGNTTQRTFDALNRVLREAQPEGRTVTLAYDAADNRLARTDPEGHTTRFVYDTLNRQIEQIDPAPFGTSISTVYDIVGNRVAETDRRGNTTQFAYDALNRLVQIADPAPLSTTESYAYDAVGNRIKTVDRRGIVTETTYDHENRPLQVKRAGLVLATNDYDENGNRRFQTDANGNVTGFEYDERDLLLAENRPLAAITRFKLDVMGDRLETRDPEGRIIEQRYDLRRRLVSTTNGAGETTSYGYDGNGNQISRERPEGGVTGFEYDGADRLIRVLDPLNNVTEYGYDRNDNRLRQTDANGATTAFEYDALNRRTAKIYPDGAREDTEYDANGNRIALIDPKGQRIEYEYDVRNREIRASYPPPSSPRPSGDDLVSIERRYDSNGNLLAAIETYSGATGVRETRYRYDAFDRIESVTDPDGQRLRYGYDANGNRTHLQDPDGRVTRSSFDALNRISTVIAGTAGITEYGYFRNGLLKSLRYPNGTRADYRYDLANRLSRIDNTQHGTAPISRFEYAYDGNGNRVQQSEVNGGGAELTAYEYDLADRLTGVVYPDQITRYTYDGVGNRRFAQSWDSQNRLIADKHYRFDDRNRLLEVSDRAATGQDESFRYDANGNRTGHTQAGVTTVFYYDSRDRLVAVQAGGQELGRYRYDHQGLRVWKESGGEALRYVYDGKRVLLQSDAAGNTVARYDYGPQRLLALEQATEGRQFYLFDALGSVVNLIRADGALQARYQYDAWGSPRATVGGSANPFGFTGQERDAATGLYYFKARYYDAGLGTFLTEDRYQGDIETPLSLHRYLYANANPTVYIDPDGNIAWLAGLRDQLTAQAERALASTEIFDGTGTLGNIGAAFTGIGASTLGLGAGGLDTANYALNWLSVTAGTEHAQEHALELQETHDSVLAAVGALAERDTWAGIGLGLVDQLDRVARGDKRAIAGFAGGFSALGTGAVLPGTGLGLVRRGGSAVERVSRVVRERIGSARSGGAVGEIARAEGTTSAPQVRAVVTEEGVQGEITARRIETRDTTQQNLAAQSILSQDLTVASRSGSGRRLKPVVLGETMVTRVNPVAGELKAHTYKPRDFDDLTTAGRRRAERNQRRWINYQIDSGRRIFDIGKNIRRPRSSPYYNIEENQLIKRGYSRKFVETIEVAVENKRTGQKTIQSFDLYEWVKN